MNRNKKLCTLFDDGEPNLMLLSEDQIAIIGWLAERGYPFEVELMPDEPENIDYENWGSKAIKRY